MLNSIALETLASTSEIKFLKPSLSTTDTGRTHETIRFSTVDFQYSF